MCALNEMNARAPPLPNYGEWRREVSGGKEGKDVRQAGIGEKYDVQQLENKNKAVKGEEQKLIKQVH